MLSSNNLLYDASRVHNIYANDFLHTSTSPDENFNYDGSSGRCIYFHVDTLSDSLEKDMCSLSMVQINACSLGKTSMKYLNQLVSSLNSSFAIYRNFDY